MQTCIFDSDSALEKMIQILESSTIDEANLRELFSEKRGTALNVLKCLEWMVVAGSGLNKEAWTLILSMVGRDCEFLGHLWSDLSCSLDWRDGALVMEWCGKLDFLMLLPTKLGNLWGTTRDTDIYIQDVCRSFVLFIQQSDGCDFQLLGIQTVLERLVSLGYVDRFWESVVSLSAKTDQLVVPFDRLDQHSLNQLLTGLLRQVSRSSSDLQSALELMRPLSQCQLFGDFVDHFIRNYFPSLGFRAAFYGFLADHDASVPRVFAVVVDMWVNSVSTHSEEFLMNVTHNLVLVLCHCRDHTQDLFLMNGISKCLDSTNYNVRTMGMFVGNLYSLVTGTRQVFPLQDSPLVKELQNTVQLAQRPIFGEVSSFSDTYSQSFDHNPDHGILIPRFLRESLEYLQSDDKVETGLTSLMEHIPLASPLVLEETYISVCKRLVSLEHSKLGQSRIKCLCILAQRLGYKVIRFLGIELYSKHIDVEQQLFILAVFGALASRSRSSTVDLSSAEPSLYESMDMVEPRDGDSIEFGPILTDCLLPRASDLDHLTLSVQVLVLERLIACLVLALASSVFSPRYIDMAGKVLDFISRLHGLALTTASTRIAVLRAYHSIFFSCKNDHMFFEHRTLISEAERWMDKFTFVDSDSLVLMHEIHDLLQVKVSRMVALSWGDQRSGLLNWPLDINNHKNVKWRIS